jgi:hypothetical protein
MITLAFPRGSDNVGDELNAWLWPALLGDLMADSQATLLGVGTLLNERFCRQLPPGEDILVVGTGAGYGRIPALNQRWKFYAVRGPRTASALGLPTDTAVADSAYLLAGLDWRRAEHTRPVGEVVFVPHHRSLPLLDWESVCRQAGLGFLSPLLPAEQFMARLCSARLVLTEAMHGAILADIARVPWRALSFGRQFNTEKWSDWSEALELDLQTTQFDGFYDPSYAANRLQAGHKHLERWLKASIQVSGFGKAKWAHVTPPSWSPGRDIDSLVTSLRSMAVGDGQLSGEGVFSRRVEQLVERVNLMRHELGGSPCSGVSGPVADFFQAVSR